MHDFGLRDVHGTYIVFCSMSGGTVHLDCISETDAARGWPFTLVVAVPEGAEWGSIAARTLGRWTIESSILEVQLENHRSPQRLLISDGNNALRLDVVDILISSTA